MPRNGTYSKTIKEYFLERPGHRVTVAALMRAAKCRSDQVSSAISYLKKKAEEGKGGLGITTLTRGKCWAYYPEFQPHDQPKPEQVEERLATEAINEPADAIERVQVKSSEGLERLFQMAGKLGGEEDPLLRRDQRVLAKWMGAELEAASEPMLTLRVLGTSVDGYMLALNESGNVFKVVPV